MKTKHALAALAAASLSLSASAASAADHLMKVNEIGLSKGGDATAQFIELSDQGGSEPFPAASYDVRIFSATNTVVGTIALASNKIQANQAHFLISTASADTKFNVTGNAVLTVALPTDGQACFRRVAAATTNIHCVAWGNVTAAQTGAETGPSPGDGESLSREPGGYKIAQATPKAANAPPSTGVDGGSEGGTTGDGGTSGGDGGTTGDDSGTSGGDGGNVGADGGTTPGGDGGDGDNGAAATDDGGCSVSTLGVGDGAAGSSLLLSTGLVGLVAAARRRKKR